MAEADVITPQDTPTTDPDAGGGHSGDTPDSPDDAGTPDGGLPGGDDKDTPSGDTPDDGDAGHGDQTPKTDRYGEEAYKTLQTTYTKEREARIDLERRLAAAEAGKPAEAKQPDPLDEITEAIKQLEAREDAEFNPAVLRELARLESRKEVVQGQRQFQQQQGFQQQREQANAIVFTVLPELKAQPGEKNYEQGLKTFGELQTIVQRAGVLGHPGELFIAMCIREHINKQHDLAKAKQEGVLTEQARKKEVKKASPAGGKGGGKGDKANYGLNAEQLERCKAWNLDDEGTKGYAKDIGVYKEDD